MSLANCLFPLLFTAYTSAILSIMYDCSSALDFQLVHVGFVSTLGMHSRIGFDSSELLIAMDIGFPIVLAQYTLHSLFLLMFLFPCPSLCSFGPLVYTN